MSSAPGGRANPPNRFERVHVAEMPELGFAPSPDDPPEDPRTELLVDPSRTIIATNDSPDLGFRASVNPYRGCQHGCSYCYARPTHEYLGYSAGLDFQTKILVKPRAAELLRKQLMSPAWKPQVLALSGVTDPYQPAERRLRITRGCLEVLAEFKNPVVIVTKGFLVTRDVDLLAELARVNAASVMLSITTLDAELQRKLEPLASPPTKRLAAIEALARAGVPVGVMTAPVIPGLTDHELPVILQAASDAGASSAGLVVLRLPHGVKELFSDWLAQHVPERREKVLNRLRALHGGALYDSRFAHRQRGSGEFAEQIQALFELGLKRARLARRGAELSTAAFKRPGVADQLSLFSSD
jgi:DNA repair photolyase